jgi:hypothetical protein
MTNLNRIADVSLKGTLDAALARNRYLEERVGQLEKALEVIRSFSRAYDLSQEEATRLLDQCTSTAYSALNP